MGYGGQFHLKSTFSKWYFLATHSSKGRVHNTKVKWAVSAPFDLSRWQRRMLSALQLGTFGAALQTRLPSSVRRHWAISELTKINVTKAQVWVTACTLVGGEAERTVHHGVDRVDNYKTLFQSPRKFWSSLASRDLVCALRSVFYVENIPLNPWPCIVHTRHINLCVWVWRERHLQRYWRLHLSSLHALLLPILTSSPNPDSTVGGRHGKRRRLLIFSR